MNIQLVRHATLLIEFDGRCLLIDPMLGDVGEFMSFLCPANHQRNPIVPLPDNLDLSSVDTAFVTHTHPDHFDEVAEQELSKELPIFCQPQDEEKLRKKHFSSVQPVEDSLPSDGIDIYRTDGRHGPRNVDGNSVDGYGNLMGPVSGFVLHSQNEPTLYIAGDTIWCPEVEAALEKHQPDIVVVNAGAAQAPSCSKPITMSKEDVAEVCRRVPSSTVIAVHMEAIDHCLLIRRELEGYIECEGLSEHVRIPADGESI